MEIIVKTVISLQNLLDGPCTGLGKLQPAEISALIQSEVSR